MVEDMLTQHSDAAKIMQASSKHSKLCQQMPCTLPKRPHVTECQEPHHFHPARS
jgi:hypothetical protein